MFCYSRSFQQQWMTVQISLIAFRLGNVDGAVVSEIVQQIRHTVRKRFLLINPNAIKSEIIPTR